MKIKFNRFALIPHICSECEELFWLEPYRRYRVVYPLLGYNETERICKKCANDIDAKKGDRE